MVGSGKQHGRDQTFDLFRIRRAHWPRQDRSVLESIRSLLRMSDDRDRSCAEVDQIANAQLTQVRSKLADLSVLQNVLQALIGQCRHGTIADCRIIEAFAPATD